MVPKVFGVNGYKFFFFSNEGNPQEPCHIHVRKSGNLAKFWVEPVVALVSSDGFSAKELRMIQCLVKEHQTQIKEAWDEFFE